MSKKILLTNTSFYPNVGGVENSLRSLTDEYRKQGHEVTVVTSNNGKLPKKETQFGADVYRYRHIPLFGYLFSMFFLFFKLKVSNYDLVISRHFSTTFVLLFLCKKKVKYIVPGVYKYQNKGLKRNFIGNLKYFINCSLESYVLKNTPEVFVFSGTMEAQVNEFRKLGVKRIFPGVDSKRFHKLNPVDKELIKRSEGLPLDKQIIFTIGRHVDVKNFSLAIDSLRHLNENIVLLLVGAGPLTASLKKQVSELKVEHRVIFKNSTPTPEKYFKIADAFLLTSTYEPFGQVLLEATASSLPVIALDSSNKGVQTATKEIYNGFYSLVYFSKSLKSEEFSRTIEDALESDLKKIHLDLFIERYSWANIASKLLP